ncbi:UDP-2,4-diacetamido-2,4,6-trideoxy-beta-L-altropyranose hydrolase [Malaciobacter molluscorum LMG 25693]|uniref:UDP-2,4-diacetamido-2,4, 6-trideoxy-beta-L-altropyranose hydrolase n=1 Tax=Malaciobacter molluscorum LMG 25693 TaxID=870501 RepID=A0A2G1DFR5_9BACT|nr:UDP-2,4-diacetamido-2,4,6-trideoxy-beta-L-altropyranose hydrolase [Malaciobacter molluscorum]AXX93555.1 UDP-2,4-diacetamido-2,4,6-trideoxy-beta-L-altropyranosyl transferase [Malaciobacter molluscorum LMG 25693]PHO17290.1 UDP-2,4-diacetamido-2,4,6-trideoxy-beta-L-altropyranose hydrolase [Malaciobacter molluscorum LMG 25693]
MKRVLIRADASFSIGHGHIMRTFVLAKEYEQKGFEVSFATLNLEGNLNKKILDNKFGLYNLNTKNIQELIYLIKKQNIDILIIDNYEIDYKSEKLIKEKTNVKILCLDDTYEKHYCDVLINHNISANEKKYKNLVPKNCKLKCGAKYTLLRDEFYKYKKKVIKKSNEKIRVFVAIGGTDHSNINIDILKVLELFENLKVYIVTTSANKNLKQLKEYCKNKDFINLYIDTKKIAKLMAKSDFAVVSASVILNEVYFMNLPFIAIKTANNQKEIYKYLNKKKYLTIRSFNKKILREYIEELIRG